MGGMISAAVSCASCACSACSCLSNVVSCLRCGKSSTRARANYFMMFVTCAMVMWLLKDYGYDGLHRLGDMKNCDNDQCTGTGAVLRISFAMVVVSSFLSLLVCGVESTENPRAVIQNDFFLFKWFLLACTTIGALYLPNENAIEYGYAAAVGGGIFMVIQAILVLEFAYSWNDTWVEYYENSDGRGWAFSILGCTTILYAVSIAVWALLLQHYGGPGCDHTNGFVSVTIVLSVLVSGLTLPEKVQQGAILPCSVIVLQCTTLCAGAVLSIPMDADHECVGRHPRASGTGDSMMQLAGIFGTIFCVGYATIRAASSGQNLTAGAKPDTALIDKEKGEEVTAEAEPDEEDTVQYNYSFFQVIYALGAMYLAMVLIDWEPAFTDKIGQKHGDMSPWTTVWIKYSSMLLTFALYTWTLIAPFVCTSRDFS